MSSFQQVIVTGNLGRDPEMRYSAEGAAIANCSIAVTERWKNGAGEQQEHTEWFRVIFFGRQAEVAGEYLKKGSKVMVIGRLRTRKYKKDDEERSITEVIAKELYMLGDGQQRSGGDDRGAARPQTVVRDKIQSGQGIGDMDDDIPF